jgi:hypothetical protein
MRIGFTDHAVDRYIQFYTDLEEPGAPLSAEERKEARAKVRELLDVESSNAVKLKEKSVRGDTMWRIEGLGCVLVTKPDRNANGQGEHVCVTILPKLNPHGMTDREMEIVQAKVEEIHLREEALRRELADAKTDAHRIATAPKNTLPSPERKEQILKGRREEIDVLTKQVQLLEWEKKILTDLLKTVRTKITQDRNLFDTKEALRLAIRCLQEQSTPEAKAALERIERIQPGFVTPQFYNLQVEMLGKKSA